MGNTYSKCGSCSRDNRPDAIFCSSCGNSILRRACGYCGTQNRSNAQYCNHCGKSPLIIEIFFSYAHEDELLRNQLATHLNALKREGLITMWNDRDIKAGTSWGVTIDEHLRTANIILLLISSDFMTSDYCYSIEMHYALERSKRGEAIVIPIILRPVDWHKAPFAGIQALPENAKPVIKWDYKDDAFVSITRGIREVINSIYME